MSGTLAKDLADRLRGHIGQGEGVVAVDRGDVSVSVDVEQSERYAVGVRGISIKPEQPVEDVRGTAERIVEGAQELGEPLTVVEYDAGGGKAIVRSAQPDADADGVTYWEADVRADETSLHRYRKDHNEPDRQVVTEPMPHATAGRVAEQLADALRNGE